MQEKTFLKVFEKSDKMKNVSELDFEPVFIL